jgi:hypothetical protein
LALEREDFPVAAAETVCADRVGFDANRAVSVIAVRAGGVR